MSSGSCHAAKEDPHARSKRVLNWDEIESYLALAKLAKSTLSAPIQSDPKYKILLKSYTDKNDVASVNQARHSALKYAKSELDKVTWDSLVSVDRDIGRLQSARSGQCFWPGQHEVGSSVKEFAKTVERGFEGGELIHLSVKEGKINDAHMFRWEIAH